MIQKTFPFFLCVVLLLSFSMTACKKESHEAPAAEAPAGGAPMQGPKVTVALPLIKEITEWEEFTGRFEAASKVEVRARVSGYLDSIHFTDGQTVKQGDLLFTIDPRSFEAAVRESEAALKSAQNMLNLAVKELERSQELTKQGYASKQTLDTKLEARQSAASGVEAAKARLEQAKLDLEYTRVTAPISGRISRHMTDAGNLVMGGTMGATMLTTVVSLDPIHFYFDIDEQTYLKYSRLESPDVKSGATSFSRPIEVALADSDTYEFRGVMDFVDTTLDPETGTLRARATLPNPSFTLVPGMFGRGRIQGGEKITATLIPDEAVGVDQTRNFVYVLGENNMVAIKNITLGGLSEEGLRIVEKGLEEKDQVIIKGIQMLREGMPVTPETTTLQAAEKPAAVTGPAAPAEGH